jgi:hypothetical protein
LFPHTKCTESSMVIMHFPKQPAGGRALTSTPSATVVARADEGARARPSWSGQPLEPAERRDYGRRFDYDFSHVRVHDDPRSAEQARTLGACAYACDGQIFLSAHAPRRGSAHWDRFLAHELAHVVQQRGTAHDGSGATAAAEAEAERAADQVTRGSSVILQLRLAKRMFIEASASNSAPVRWQTCFSIG